MLLDSQTDDLAEQLRWGFQRVNSRNPSQQEIELMHSLYQKEYTRFQKNSDEAQALLQIGLYNSQQNLDASQHAAMTVVANMLLNLDEAKMKS